MHTIKHLLFCCIILFSIVENTCAFGVSPYSYDDFLSTEEILAKYHDITPTQCASEIFLDALQSKTIPDDTPEYEARMWAKKIMQSSDVLIQVLECPEIKNLPEDKTINFTPITYTFQNGRTLNISYSSQPRILKQHILMSTKRSLTDNSINPELNNPEDPGIYMNTDPAWYAIMVVQHNSLSEFVGPGKNNTLSLKYINDNIDSIYPKGYMCTSKSAIALDNDTINKATRETVNMENDSNDYYVAGDVDLGWIMYAEIALDVVMWASGTAVGQIILTKLKDLSSVRAARKLFASIKQMKEIEEVSDYIKKMQKIKDTTENIENLTKNSKEYKKLIEKILKAKKAGEDQAEINKLAKQARELLDKSKKIDPSITSDVLRDAKQIDEKVKPIRDTIKEVSKEAEELAKASEDVEKYKEAAETLQDLMKFRRELTAYKRPITGNIITRALKSLRASNKGADIIAKANKVGRAGMSSTSAKIGDWLFEMTLKHGARFGRFERDVSMLYGAVTFLADMYDHTSNTSQEFTNGIEFKPLCLLSADDLQGYDNVVNYGMWLLWMGNSTDANDDDAAYLQAMDFATKFHYNLERTQDKDSTNCNVDIYVVRPIIRLDETDPSNVKGEMFYLFMNDIPWTTADQFGENVPDIKEWERVQSKLNEEDPLNKYRKTTENNDSIEILNENSVVE